MQPSLNIVQENEDDENHHFSLHIARGDARYMLSNAWVKTRLQN